MIIQERDGDAWGQGIVLEAKRRVWMLGLFWSRSLHDWIWGVMEREGSRKTVVLQMGNPGAGAWEEDQTRLDLLNEKCLLSIKGETWKGSWICKSRMEGRVLGWRHTLGSCQHIYDLQTPKSG